MQTRQSLIDAACFIAGQDGIDHDVVADILLPRVFRHVADQAAADPHRRGLVQVQTTMTVSNGAAVLPANVLTRYIYCAAIQDPLDATMANRMRYVADWNEFVRPLDLTLGYFTVVQFASVNEFFMTKPGVAFFPGTGFSGSIQIMTPTMPAIPVLATDPINVPGGIEDDLILALAAALKGGWMDVAVEKGKAA